MVHYSSISAEQSVKDHESPVFILQCRVDGNHLHGIQWLKNDKPLDPTKFIDIHSNRLVIRHPRNADNGYYKCVARNKIGSIQSKPYRVEFYTNNHNSYHYPLVCTEMNNNKINGETKSLLCRHKRSDRRRSHHKRSTFDDQPDALQKPPRKRLNIDENHSATINCDLKHVDRSNQIIVRWKKDGKLIRQSNLNGLSSDLANINPIENSLLRDDGRISMHTKNGSLLILSTIPSDSGFYECSISQNGNGISNVQTTELNIIEKLKFSPAPTTSKGLEMGSIGKIHCRVQGTPTPLIRWIKVCDYE